MPIDVYIGADDGYVHRVHIGYGSGQTTRVRASTQTSMTLGLGLGRLIDVPSDDEVLDATSLLAALGSKP